MATNFGTKIDYNLALVNNNCALFSPSPYFRARAIRWCYLNFSPADYCCHGNEFWDKIDYGLTPRLFGPAYGFYVYFFQFFSQFFRSFSLSLN